MKGVLSSREDPWMISAIAPWWWSIVQPKEIVKYLTQGSSAFLRSVQNGTYISAGGVKRRACTAARTGIEYDQGSDQCSARNLKSTPRKSAGTSATILLASDDLNPMASLRTPSAQAR